MKASALLLFLILDAVITSSFAVAMADLSDFPFPFVNNGFDMIAVSGKNPDDISAKYDFLNNLAKGIITDDSTNPGTLEVQSVLVGESINLSQNIVSVGGPCANNVTASIMDMPSTWPGCAAGFANGTGNIRIYHRWNKTQLILAGYTAEDTKSAVSAVLDYEEFRLSGYRKEVYGDVTNPHYCEQDFGCEPVMCNYAYQCVGTGRRIMCADSFLPDAKPPVPVMCECSEHRCQKFEADKPVPEEYVHSAIEIIKKEAPEIFNKTYGDPISQWVVGEPWNLSLRFYIGFYESVYTYIIKVNLQSKKVASILTYYADEPLLIFDKLVIGESKSYVLKAKDYELSMDKLSGFPPKAEFTVNGETFSLGKGQNYTALDGIFQVGVLNISSESVEFELRGI